MDCVDKRHFFDEIVSIMERLRAPDGCPWDREQKLRDLRPYIVEEAHELAEAISEAEEPGSDLSHVMEEAGDLLLQIVFVSAIAKESGAFGIEDVVRAICEKLIRRHPHVFKDVTVENSDEVLRNWEQIKREERREKRENQSALAGVPKGLPSLLKAYRMQDKAAHVGFDWPRDNLEPLFEKLDEETAELKTAIVSGSEDAVEEELGDMLFMAVNLSRHLNINPDAALSRACRKFGDRFQYVERTAAERGIRMDGDNKCSLEELDSLWNEAKKQEKKR